MNVRPVETDHSYSPTNGMLVGLTNVQSSLAPNAFTPTAATVVSSGQSSVTSAASHIFPSHTQYTVPSAGNRAVPASAPGGSSPNAANAVPSTGLRSVSALATNIRTSNAAIRASSTASAGVRRHHSSVPSGRDDLQSRDEGLSSTFSDESDESGLYITIHLILLAINYPCCVVYHR